MNTPTKPGFYWAKMFAYPSTPSWEVVKVVESGYHDTLVIHQFHIMCGPHEMDRAVEWGPRINPPSEEDESEYLLNYLDPLRDPDKNIYG